MMQRADEKLIPSVAKELKETFNANLYDIGYLTFIRNIVQGVASPLAGLFVISYDRPTVFAFGCFCWVISTVAVGASQLFIEVSFGVAVNGFGHAIVYPVLQSIIADSFKDNARGFGFGLWNLIGTVGAIGGTVVATVMAGHEFSGFPGWRCAFVLMATMSLVIGILVFLFTVDPRKKKTSNFVSHVLERDDVIIHKAKNYDVETMEIMNSMWMESWKAIKDVTKLRTFQIIVLQGIVGLVPWNAMVFWTMWFELIGFDHNQTASLNGIFTAGQAIGSLIGGIIADKMSRAFPNSGRLFCAQFSVLMGAIFSIILLRIIPQSINSYYIFMVTLFHMGLIITWCGPAINSPILAEIVPPKHRTMVYAFDRALEVSFSSFGAPLVGIMSEKFFGFDTKGIDNVIGSSREAEALSKGIVWMMALPFGLCCLCYTPRGTLYGISISLIIINLATIMQRADEKLIPSTAKEVKETFHANLYDIGLLSFIRNVVQGIASPLAGLFVISYDRPTIFALGSFFWVSSSVATGLSRYFIQVTFGVAFNGFGHAIVYPVLQSIIADSFKDNARGFGFGLWNLIGTIGGIGGTVVPTIMAGHVFFGISGWRCAYLLSATLSTMIGFLVFFFVDDPREKKSTSSSIVPDHERDGDNVVGATMEDSKSIWRESWMAIKDVAKLRTFQIIVLQGIIGSVPWNAMVFWTMWFELIGFNHNQAAFLNGIFTAGQAIGSLIGGIIADKMSRAFPNSGRLFCAQFSVFMGSIFSIILLKIIPQSINSYYIYLVTLFLMGLTITWCGPAINSPILAEIVPPKHRTMVYAFDRALEVSFSSFGAPLVGIMSEKIFGFNTKVIDNVKDSSSEAEALSKGIMWMMAAPFGLCCLCYTPLHFIFRKDRKIDRNVISIDVEIV
ncbi:unnamed protein product [Cochlearia groenlandica]